MVPKGNRQAQLHPNLNLHVPPGLRGRHARVVRCARRRQLPLEEIHVRPCDLAQFPAPPVSQRVGHLHDFLAALPHFFPPPRPQGRHGDHLQDVHHRRRVRGDDHDLPRKLSALLRHGVRLRGRGRVDRQLGKGLRQLGRRATRLDTQLRGMQRRTEPVFGAVPPRVNVGHGNQYARRLDEHVLFAEHHGKITAQQALAGGGQGLGEDVFQLHRQGDLEVKEAFLLVLLLQRVMVQAGQATAQHVGLQLHSLEKELPRTRNVTHVHESLPDASFPTDKSLNLRVRHGGDDAGDLLSLVRLAAEVTC